jgi:mercuric reductase
MTRDSADSESFDLIVLGSGSAARDGAGKAAREYDARVALIERVRWGGSCPNVACKPTKAYLVAADLLHDINELAGLVGIEVGQATANMRRIRERKDQLRKPQPKWVEDLRNAGFTTIEGVATFVDAHTVRVGDRLLTADKILIATGSRTAVPPIEGIDEIDWIDHVSALELTELPESLLVLGGGAVGLEFGQAFSRFGSRVTIVDALERISARSDVDAANELSVALEDEGIEVIVNTFVKRVVRDGGEIVATLAPRDGGAERELRVSQVLLASGRVPNIEELDLDAAGLEYSKAGIKVDEYMRTNADGIWAVGDATAIAQFTPIAQYQARIAVENMFTGNGRAADYSILPTSIFTDPELASVGLAEFEAAEQGFETEAVTHPLSSVQRASYTNTKHGLFKIVFERGTRRVLGLHVVAPNGGDIVHGFSLALKKGITVDEIANAHHVFPTIGEGLKAAAEKALVPVKA